MKTPKKGAGFWRRLFPRAKDKANASESPAPRPTRRYKKRSSRNQPIRNKVISVWLDEETKKILCKYADENQRSISNQAAIYIVEGLLHEPNTTERASAEAPA
uniref:Uncharacterized protein n=1 Tax=Candidatus Kentrum sp. LPFa TaxID=2126335 RepID=A0A450X3T4_9GAMM|nr:MAG: hypothetical protein BECKLPF1236B_GA0070989_13853 [Candidatus Kentron sp. LPFa]